SPGTFESGNDITIFESRLTNFFIANGISNEVQKRAILLSSISEEVHKILFSLCVPAKPDVQTYDTLLGLLNNYYKPVKSYFASRYAFYNAKQRPDETVAEWGARVKNLASKYRLLEEDASKISITYSQLMEISAAKESTINNKTGWIKEEADFKYQKQSQQAKSAKQSITEKSKCGTCGRSNHTQKECRYKDYSCNICNIKGHLAPMCKSKNNKPKYDNRSHNKFLSGAIPKFFKPRSIPLALKSKVESEIDRLIDNNILTPVNYSEWATPIVPILKPDGTVRICGDFKITINPVLEGTEYPLPKIEHLYANISGSKYFSKIDLKDAYQQMVIKESDRKYTTINTHKGLFSYTRNPFGIKSSAGEFQKAMEISTTGLEGIGIFQDDIIVAGKTVEEHNNRLKKLLNVLSEVGLRVKQNKCSFLKNSIEYLGHKIDEHGLHTLTKHINAIQSALVPENKTIAADILKPLYSLLRQEKKWLWSPECDQAYNNIKKMLISSPVLAHYDQKLPIKLTVDSSSYALGAIISHTYPDHSERPIAYASRVLSNSECKFPQIEKEGLAIIFGVQKFYDYLYGRKFTLVTDHKPLIHIFGKKKGIPIYAANRLQRWAYVLSSFDFEIKYIKSEGNTADFLSRIKTNQCNNNINEYDDAHINFIHEQSPFPLDWHKIKIETKRDPITSRVLHATKTGSWSNDFSINSELNSYNTRKIEITAEQDCLFWGYRVIIPTKFRKSILTELHSCHIGMSSMKSIARSYFWWPSIDKEIEDMARNCNECINARPNPPKSVLTPWKWPQRQWTRVHCDFLRPYKNKTFLIIVDATTKWLEVFQ
ncbi:uncharacterized protein K02A2.6-like, partial [Acyrthosiphon pisum]|uniref:RNA-directed DNA polymerase n=1 Tax=Acyrthosiphon pisum TaxID=7029 RepID=A0A8R2NTL2_ACYPI